MQCAECGAQLAGSTCPNPKCGWVMQDWADEIGESKWADYRSKLVKQAKDGDVDAAIDLIEVIAGRLRTRKPLPDDLNDYLLESLERVLNGEDGDRAFNLVRPVGGQRTERTAPGRDDGVIVLVELKMRELRPPDKDGRTQARPSLDDSDFLPEAKKRALQALVDAVPAEASGQVFSPRRLEQILEERNGAVEGIDPIKVLSDEELKALVEVAVEVFRRHRGP